MSNFPKSRPGYGLVLLIFLAAFSYQSFGQVQTLYSKATTNWNDTGGGTQAWSLSGHNGANCGCVPDADDIVLIGDGHTITIPSGYTAVAGSIIIDDDNGGGTLRLGTNFPNTGLSLTVAGDITINAGGTLTTGGDGDATHTLTIGGNLTNNNVFDMRNEVAGTDDFVNVTFNGSATRTISGTPSFFYFYDFILDAGGNDLNIEASIYIGSSIDFQANGLLIVDANSNITLSENTNINNSSANRYIQLDGTSGSNSQLIRENGGDDADWEFLFPIGTASGGYTPFDLRTGNGANVIGNPDNGSTLAVKAIYSASSIGKMRRTFRLVVNGNDNNVTFTNARFYYNTSTDVSLGDVLANYSTIWYLNTTSGWSTVGGTAPGGAGFFTTPSSGETLGAGTYFYTIGTVSAYPSVWYSYQNGVWSDPNVWTLDPSGTTWVNALSQYPNFGDEVVILNGFTVTSDLSSLALSKTTIQGGATLDMSTTTGHSLGTIEGSGLLRVNGINLPAGTYLNFVNSTGGTIEYYNTGGDLPTFQTEYNNLKMTNNSGSITYTLVSNLTVNGNFEISSSTDGGTTTWQINDNSNTQRTITLLGDLTVASNGRITVGTGNEGSANQHNLAMHGNITNDGIIKFYDPLDPELDEDDYGLTYPVAGVDLHRNELQGNAVTVTFSGNANKTVTCNNTTDFYRFVVDKGTGQQARVTVNSASTNYFRLFGPSDRPTVESGPSYDYVSNNALSIVNGTLELTGSINIPNLCIGFSTTDYFPIPRNGALWLNGPDVTVNISDNTPDVNNGNKDGRILMSGLLRITAGTLNGGYSKGLGSQDGGSYLQEGGTVNCWQFRPRAVGTGIFSFTQSGGVLNVGYGFGTGPNFSKIDIYEEAYSRFDLNSPNSTFQMSGDAVMNVAKPTNNNNGNGGLFKIASTPGNFNVTGGTVNLYTGVERDNNSSYPGYINTTAPLYNVNIYEESNTTQNPQLEDNSLVVLNNLTLNNSGGGNAFAFVTNNLDVTVGGDFIIQSGTTYTPGNNTTTFNGAGAQAWTHDGTITSLNNVVVNKSAGVLTCGGSQTFPNITSLTLTSGTLNDGGKTLTVTNTLSNSATHTGTGSILANGPTTIDGNNGTFGNLTVNTNAAVATAGKQTVTGNLRLINANTTLNIGSNNLTVLGNIYSNGATGVAFNGTKRILTNGLRNDGGLTRQATSAADLLFPVGTSVAATNYTPATINVTATTVGLITVRPVAASHPNVTTTGQSVRYYWRVTSTGFAGIASVVHKSYTYAGATRDAASAAYRPARYDETGFTWAYGPTYNATAGGGTTTIPNFNTGLGWIGLSADRLDGEYTAGNALAFQSVTVYYSRTSGNWGNAATWSNVAVGGAAGSGTPCPTCPVVIGDGGSNNHTITINANNQGGGSLYLAPGSTLDCGAFTGLNFGVNTTGTGLLRISGTAFPSGDFLSFLGTSGGSVEWYGNTKTIPATGPAPMSLSLATYYNLIVSPNNGQDITLPASNLTIYNNLTSSGNGSGQVRTNTGATRTINVQNNMNVVSGSFSFRNGNTTNLNLSNDLTISNGATVTVQTGGTRTHTLTSQGNIINNGTILFRSGNEFVNIVFTGADDKSFTGSGTSTTLNQLTVDKGTSQTPTLTFDVTGTVNTLTNNWLNLVNGTMIFDNANTYNLSTATTGYNIPSTACLRVDAGTVTVASSNNNNADLILVGKLEVRGGTVNIGNSGNNTNNDIEYAAAGAPTIVVSGGTLYVNGAVRRSTATLTGALMYTQTGGTVTVGGRNADTSRGVFEIENNAGSLFTLTGSSVLQVLRSSGGNAFPDLYLNPASSNVSSSSTIEIGANGLGAETLTMNVVPALGNFTVMGSGGNAQTVNMQSSELTTSGTLTINTASTLNTNALNVNIGGDLDIDGTYNGSANTTTFNGIGIQGGSLSASSTFQNITVDKPSGTVTLSGTSPTITDLNILNGVLDVSTIGLTVNGNITNNSSQIGTGSINMAGTATSHTITSSGGSFTNLTLTGGAATKSVVVSGNLTINGVLNFATTNRYLTIGSSRLTFGQSGSVSGAGSSAFIRTNGVSSDLGVLKMWPAGNNSFTYHVGTMSNYTPVQMTLNVTNAGNLTVAPVNSRHPSYGFASTENILNYYWIVRRDASIAYTTVGSHAYSYSSGLMGGSGGTLVAGYLDLSNPTGWVTSGHGGVAAPTLMTYTNLLNSNLPASGITYHFTVGTINTLPNPIATVYSRLSNPLVSNTLLGGNWDDPASWTLSPTGFGVAISSVPAGAPVVILNGSRINTNVNSRSALTIEINGLLVLGSTTGHNFGTISGTGTMRTATNTFPAGDYTAFVSSSGGTIEYVAPMTMNNRVTYNNISVIGTGALVMTNTDIVLNGDLTIGLLTTLNNSVNNRNITIAGDWNNSGSFTSGTGTVIFNGSTDQSINGLVNTFSGLTVSKSGGEVILAGVGATTVNGMLTLTNGHVESSLTNILSLGSSATLSGGSVNSFVSGPMRKTIASGGSFTFPVGSTSNGNYRPAGLANTSAPDTWTIHYIASNPTSGGFSNLLMNLLNLQRVSEFEYWDISRVGVTSANVSLSYGPGSYNGSDIGVLSSLRVGHWDGLQWDLPTGGGVHNASGSITAGTVTVTNVTSFSPFTLTSIDANSPLPVNWLSFTADRVSSISVVLKWKTAQEENNDRFEIEHSHDGKEFTRIGTVKGAGTTTAIQSYQFTDAEASTWKRHYYRIKQIDYDGKFDYSAIAVVYESDEAREKRWTVYPNPIAQGQSFTLGYLDDVDDEEYVNVMIVSATGQVVFHESGSFGAISRSLEWLSNAIGSGAYVLKITNGTDTEMFRLVRH